MDRVVLTVAKILLTVQCITRLKYKCIEDPKDFLHWSSVHIGKQATAMEITVGAMISKG